MSVNFLNTLESGIKLEPWLTITIAIVSIAATLSAPIIPQIRSRERVATIAAVQTARDAASDEFTKRKLLVAEHHLASQVEMKYRPYPRNGVYVLAAMISFVVSGVLSTILGLGYFVLWDSEAVALPLIGIGMLYMLASVVSAIWLSALIEKQTKQLGLSDDGLSSTQISADAQLPTERKRLPFVSLRALCLLVVAAGVVLLVGSVPAFWANSLPASFIGPAGAIIAAGLASSVALRASASWKEQRAREVEAKLWEQRSGVYEEVIADMIRTFNGGSVGDVALERARVALWATPSALAAFGDWFRLATAVTDGQGGSVRTEQWPAVFDAVYSAIENVRRDTGQHDKAQLPRDEVLRMIFANYDQRMAAARELEAVGQRPSEQIGQGNTINTPNADS